MWYSLKFLPRYYLAIQGTHRERTFSGGHRISATGVCVLCSKTRILILWAGEVACAMGREPFLTKGYALYMVLYIPSNQGSWYFVIYGCEIDYDSGYLRGIFTLDFPWLSQGSAI